MVLPVKGIPDQGHKVKSMFNREATPITNRIMKSIKNLFPALALVLGASMAMAMNFANNPTERYAEDPAPGTEVWYDLTDINPGPSTYQCDEEVDQTCSHMDPNSSSNEVEEGEFIKNGSLPLATL